ncbi:MAG: bifunctional 3-(3-hydroxy-phenyl)propionate/3-hydroxycinnamic acid hydroxylase [Pseudomonadota bacterium]
MTLQLNNNADIAIIGAGPTGLMLANLLGLHGVKTTIFERRTEPFTEPRAIAFDPETLRLFQKIDCYDALSKTLQLDVPVHYLNANGKTLAYISDCPPAFGHSGRGTYYQPELENALQEGLNSRTAVELRRGIEVGEVRHNEEQVKLRLTSSVGETSEFTAGYVVDCSGGASRIRKQLGINFAGTTYREKWLVIDVEGDDYEGCEIKFFCDPKRPAVTLPVSNNRRRWEFLVMPGDDETELASEESARALMATYGAGNAERIERSLVYTFHARFADRFREGRVLLAGDAAHVMPPFAGQGLNSGMRDTANLAWKLAGIVQGTFEETILDTYEPERRPHVEDMTKLTIKLGQSIMPTSAVRAWFRDRMMLTAWRFPKTREKLNRGDMIPKPSIKGSSLVNWARGGNVGQMIDQPTIIMHGQPVKLDQLLGRGFSAIGLNCDVRNSLCEADCLLLKELDAAFVSISSSSIQQVDDLKGLFGNLETTNADKAILILRPDRFVIDAFVPSDRRQQLSWMKEPYGIVRSLVDAQAA